jgi:hypothetical protein
MQELAYVSKYSESKIKRIIYYWLAKEPPKLTIDYSTIKHVMIDATYFKNRKKKAKREGKTERKIEVKKEKKKVRKNSKKHTFLTNMPIASLYIRRSKYSRHTEGEAPPSPPLRHCEFILIRGNPLLCHS